MLLFWGCAQCCKIVGDGSIKMALGRRRRRKNLKKERKINKNSLGATNR